MADDKTKIDPSNSTQLTLIQVKKPKKTGYILLLTFPLCIMCVYIYVCVCVLNASVFWPRSKKQHEADFKLGALKQQHRVGGKPFQAQRVHLVRPPHTRPSQQFILTSGLCRGTYLSRIIFTTCRTQCARLSDCSCCCYWKKKGSNHKCLKNI